MIYTKDNRVERHWIKPHHPMYKIIDNYCYKSKNLYNYANYIVRQSFVKDGVYIPYNELTKKIKHDDPFRDIGSNSGQHTLKLLHQNWKSYLNAAKDYIKNPKKYFNKPKIPGYLPKDGRFVWVLTNMQSKIYNQEIVFSFKPLKRFNGLFKTKISGKHMQTRFIKRNCSYVMEIVYEIDLLYCKRNIERVVGIDLGISNFATLQNNFKERSVVINGKKLKSINNFYNKEKSRLSSEAKRVNGVNWTKKLDRLTNKRNNKVENFLHHASKFIVTYCKNHEVDTVIVGYNQKWKQSLDLNKKIKQSFVYIPYEKFIKKLEYKLKDKNITLVLTDESYTSKASFIDADEMNQGVVFSGERIYRGLYRTAKGKLINADVNGAGNIIRKVYPNAFVDGLKGVDLHPLIINVI